MYKYRCEQFHVTIKCFFPNIYGGNLKETMIDGNVQIPRAKTLMTTWELLTIV